MASYTEFLYVGKPDIDSVIQHFSVSPAGWIWSHSSSDFCGLFIFRFEYKKKEKKNGVICCVWSWREGKEPMEPETSKTVRGLQNQRVTRIQMPLPVDVFLKSFVHWAFLLPIYSKKRSETQFVPLSLVLCQIVVKYVSLEKKKAACT